MKKFFTIEINIDTTQKLLSGSGAKIVAINKSGEHLWRIDIADDIHEIANDKKLELLAALSHELGHVLSNEILGSENQVTYLQWKKDAIDEEHRAWNIGEAIFKEIKSKALKTYKDNYPEDNDKEYRDFMFKLKSGTL